MSCHYTMINAAAETQIDMHYVPPALRFNSTHCYLVRITDVESGDTIYSRYFQNHDDAYSYYLRSGNPPQSRKIDSPTFLPAIR